jgi:hypothetical protein
MSCLSLGGYNTIVFKNCIARVDPFGLLPGLTLLPTFTGAGVDLVCIVEFKEDFSSCEDKSGDVLAALSCLPVVIAIEEMLFPTLGMSLGEWEGLVLWLGLGLQLFT